MKKATLHITCAFLLVVSLLPVAYPCILGLQKIFARWEMKEKLENEQLQTIRVKTSEVTWTFLHRECRIDGKMFDVKKIVEEGEYLRLTGLYDEKETEIENNISRNSSDQNKKAVTIMAAFAQAITDHSSHPFVPMHLTQPVIEWQSLKTAVLPTSTKIILTPPPES
ncbi:MAG: hypothetical protein WBP58_05550 [Chitinophagaceae bacterium]